MSGQVKGGTIHTLVEEGELRRYDIRNSLFRLRDNRIETGTEMIVQAIYRVFLDQLQREESLETFTFNWDVHPKKILEIIRPQDWRIAKKHMHPDAFKNGKRVTIEERLFTFQFPDMDNLQPNYRRHLKQGLNDLKRETLRILRLPLDQELLALVNEETREEERKKALKQQLEEAEYAKAEQELAELVAVAQNRSRTGDDISDIVQQMSVVSAKLRRNG